MQMHCWMSLPYKQNASPLEVSRIKMFYYVASFLKHEKSGWASSGSSAFLPWGSAGFWALEQVVCIAKAVLSVSFILSPNLTDKTKWLEPLSSSYQAACNPWRWAPKCVCHGDLSSGVHTPVTEHHYSPQCWAPLISTTSKKSSPQAAAASGSWWHFCAWVCL